MKKVLLLTSLTICYLFFQSSMNGVTTAQLTDRTNSPVNNGNCASCHSGGSFSPSLTVELMDKNNNTVTTYVPGETYVIKYTVNATGASKYGLQSTVLASDTSNAGTLSAKSANTKVLDLNKRTYLDHKSPSVSNVFEANWVAPTNPSGDVTIYTGALAANGNNGTSGDSYTSADPMVIKLATGLVLDASVSLGLYPNPTHNTLTVLSSTTPDFIEVYSVTGEIMTSAQHAKSIDISGQASGVYLIRVKIGETMYTKKIIKQ